MKMILLDTNFLIDLGRFGISIDEIDKVVNERYELAVLSSVVNELKSIAGTQQEESKFAKVALMILDLRKVKIIQNEKTADQAFLDIAQNEADVTNIVVGTNDVELRKRLEEKGIRCIYLRGKKKLEIK